MKNRLVLVKWYFCFEYEYSFFSFVYLVFFMFELVYLLFSFYLNLCNLFKGGKECIYDYLICYRKRLICD